MKDKVTWYAVGEIFFRNGEVTEALWRELGGLIEVDFKIIAVRIRSSKDALEVAQRWATQHDSNV
jgi:hypothetical protein